MVVWQMGMTLEDTEKLIVLQAYRLFENNKTRTANALGICIRTLDARLEKYDKDNNERAAASPGTGERQFTEVPKPAESKTDGLFHSGRIHEKPVAESATEQSMSVRKRQKV